MKKLKLLMIGTMLLVSSCSTTSTSQPKYVETASTYEDYSYRCQATTQKGYQCKRRAASNSSYCWQHK